MLREGRMGGGEDGESRRRCWARKNTKSKVSAGGGREGGRKKMGIRD